MLQAGAIVADHLRLVRQLGSGGMGSVWVAEQTRLGGLVAVKFLSTALLDHESARSRFDREAKLAAKIKSQHVVQVHDHGVTKTEPAIPYIVMELLEGMDLSKTLDHDGPIGLTRAAEIVEQVCDALTRAHGAGVVHRDIKPENVFVLNESRTFVKLLDFGVAHGQDGQIDRLTQTGLLLGTAHYMSPEQLFSGKDIDLRADLWALGVLTYQMLTNEVPFQAETFGQLCLQVRDGSFPPVSSRVNVPPGVDQWFTKALDTDRVNRFQSAAEMAAAFHHVVAGGLLDADVIPNAAHVTQPSAPGTGTVKVGQSEISRLKAEYLNARSSSPSIDKSPSVDHQPSPPTQRMGSQSGLVSSSPVPAAERELAYATQIHSDSASDVVRESETAMSRSGARSGPIASDTPLSDLSGSFGTEARGVLAMGPRPIEADKPRLKWIGWSIAAVLLGAGALFVMLPRAADTPPEADALTTTSGVALGAAAATAPLAPTPSAIADVVTAGLEPSVALETTTVQVAAVAGDIPPSTPPESATVENTAIDGKQPSPSEENAVTGASVPAAPGNSESSGPRDPKASGVLKTPRSSTHVSSDKSPLPAHSSSPAPQPDPALQRKPKYRGF